MLKRLNKSKRVLFLIAFIIAYPFFFVLHPEQVYAADYGISYTISYVIDADGTANVDYTIRLINESDSFYISSESLTTTQTDIQNLRVVNSIGIRQSFSVSKTNATTTITTTFSNPAVGKGSFNQWDIQYTTKQIASNIGHAWNILIPGFGDRTPLHIDNLSISVTIPKSFGPLNYASPSNNSQQDLGNQTRYTFTNNTITTAGINLLLGNAQTYAFSFSYPLQNMQSGTAQYTIAVPPDTTTQQILFTHIDPTPDSFTINNDGDYVLSYLLGSRRTGNITVSGIASVSTDYNKLNKPLTNPIQLSGNDQKAYTAETTYWQTHDSQIQDLATSLTKDSTTNVDKAHAIYTYLVQTFKYNRQAVFDTSRTRKGAVYAINHPTDVICQEYVDAFVALTRSVGVPAVFDAGYGNTLSPLNTLPPNVLHAWAEFYDPSYGWIPVDPTWGASGADFFGDIGTSHMLLARYGYSDQEPVLVASFTTESNATNAIKVAPTEDAFTSNPTFIQTNTDALTISGGLASVVALHIQNTGNRVLFLDHASIKVNAKEYTESDAHTNAYLFPTMTGNIVIPMTIGDLVTQQTFPATLVLSYTDTTKTQPIVQTYHEPLHISPVWVIGILPLIAVIFIFVLSYAIVSLITTIIQRFAKKDIS